MADTLDILTLDEAKAYLSGLSGSSRDAQVAALVTAISRRIDALCGPVVQRTVSAEVHAGGCSTIRLNLTPVSSVTTVSEYAGSTPTTITAETTPGLAGSGYLLVDGTTHGARLIRRSGGYDTWWTAGRSNVLVTYVAGRYANTSAVDGQFKVAAGRFLQRAWRSAEGSGSETYGASDAFVQSPTMTAPKEVRDLLADQLLPPAVAS